MLKNKIISIISIIIIILIFIFILYRFLSKKKKIEPFNSKQYIASYNTGATNKKDILNLILHFILKKDKLNKTNFHRNNYEEAITQPIYYNLIEIKYEKNYYDPQNEISNSLFQNKILNYLLEEITIIKKYQELNFKPVKLLKYDYWNGFQGDKINIELLDRNIILIINKLNYIIFENNLNKDYLFRFFIIIERKYINIETHDNIIKITTIVNIYRPFKYTGFQLKCTYIINNKEIIILKIKIIGNFRDSEIKVDNLHKYILLLKQIIPFNSEFPYFKLPKNSSKFQRGYLMSIKDSPIIFPKVKQIKILWTRYFAYLSNLYSFSFRCIGSEGDNLFRCTSTKNIAGKEKNVGLWDRPCYTNSECPFYKSNQNYPNNFGGCRNGVCQMPIGVTRIGYHFYTNLNNAYCYNCKGEKYNCCETQRLNLKQYPNLVSPDYAFNGDNRNTSTQIIHDVSLEKKLSTNNINMDNQILKLTLNKGH